MSTTLSPSSLGASSLAPRSATDDPILRAAHELIVESGVSKLTVQAVARRAGVSRMTVYRHHANLDGIIRNLMTAEIGAIIASARDAVAGAADVRAGVTAAVVHVVRELSDHRLFRSVIETDASVLLPLLTTRFGSGQSLLRDQLRDFLRAGMTRFGGDGSVSDVDPEELAFMMVIACQSFVVSGFVVEQHVDDVGAHLERLVSRWLA